MGSNFINYIFNKIKNIKLVNIDALYYCANKNNIDEKIRRSSDYIFVEGNTNNIKLISDIAQKFGSQSTVASIDVKKINEEYFVFFENGSLRSEFILEDYIKLLRDYGAGEIILTSINNEGSRSGFDLELYKRIDKLVNIPIIANGGAKNLADFEKLFSKTNISSASGGACFVYYGSRKAVLINYPNKFEINEIMERYEG